MSVLHHALTEYLRTRRALGTKLRWPESSLRKFVDFIEAEGEDFVTISSAMRWAIQPAGVQRATHARRLGIVRGFALWLQATDTRTQVPPHGSLPARRRRPLPHIYSDREIADLMGAAGKLRSAVGLRCATCRGHRHRPIARPEQHHHRLLQLGTGKIVRRRGQSEQSSQLGLFEEH